MTIDIPIEQFTTGLGIPNTMFFAIAAVMAVSMFRKLLGVVLCLLVLFAFILRPDIVTSAFGGIFHYVTSLQ
jgi:glucan phosphoethanolaminetransferase (alkaline phosphatase superfamily)